MHHIGILAYGSLIEDPGEEIASSIVTRAEDVDTPFKVEFARSSTKRDGAPTLVPVEGGGDSVRAQILILRENITVKKAEDMLWRREACRIGTGETYDPPETPGPNTVLVERLEDFHDVGLVLYARIAPNIEDLSPQKLAELAIESARADAGSEGRDGISYLIVAKRNGTCTPLMPEYEREILRQTGTKDLMDALNISLAQ